MVEAKAKAKQKVTVGAVLIKPDGTRIDAGIVSGKRTFRQWLHYRIQRRKIEKYNRELQAEVDATKAAKKTAVLKKAGGK